MKKVMLCLPIIGKTKDEINASIEKAKASFLAREEINYDVIFIHDYLNIEEKEIINKNIYYISVFTTAMSISDIIYFCEGWQTDHDCRDLYSFAKMLEKDMILDCNDLDSDSKEVSR